MWHMDLLSSVVHFGGVGGKTQSGPGKLASGAPPWAQSWDQITALRCGSAKGLLFVSFCPVPVMSHAAVTRGVEVIFDPMRSPSDPPRLPPCSWPRPRCLRPGGGVR